MKEMQLRGLGLGKLDCPIQGAVHDRLRMVPRLCSLADLKSRCDAHSTSMWLLVRSFLLPVVCSTRVTSGFLYVRRSQTRFHKLAGHPMALGSACYSFVLGNLDSGSDRKVRFVPRGPKSPPKRPRSQDEKSLVKDSVQCGYY